MRTTRLRVTLREVAPSVQRVLDIPAAITLDELHEALQLALGWTDSHLHQYRTHSTVYSIPSDNAWADEPETDERGVRLSALPSRFTYLYDFGDGWTHDVEVLGPGGDAAGCVDGEGACPPEDCGGPCGYAELLAALADPRHPEHAEMREWVSDRLRPFDRTATDRRVRDAVGQVSASVRLLLGLLTSGVKLTPGGRLPAPWCGPFRNSARTGIRSAVRRRSRRTCCRWPRYTTSSATSVCCGSRMASSARQRPPATRSRRSAGCAPGSHRGSSTRSSPSARWPWWPRGDR